MSTTSFDGPMHYDATSENEIEVPLPSEPRVLLAPNAILQPPLTRRGYGPALVLLLPDIPNAAPIGDTTPTTEQIDPEPVQKWAEEGFAVLALYASKGAPGEWSLKEVFSNGLTQLQSWADGDDVHVIKNKVAIIVHEPTLLPADFAESDFPIQTIVMFGSNDSSAMTPHTQIPTLSHICFPALTALPPAVAKPHKAYTYENQVSAFFSFPGGSDYNHHRSSHAHARTLSWIKTRLNGPWFDLEGIWEEHTGHEFFTRSVAKTMGTMVAQPYVNHVPTITGGVGRRDLTVFYRDHFIFSNPRDTVQTMVSRCVGIDRIAEEFIFAFTHDQPVDWLLPGVPPTGKKIEIPMNAFVSIRGDRLYHEHISWDQATAYRQVGLLPTHVPFQNDNMPEAKALRLPTSDGADSAKMLMAVGAVQSNQMFEWGLEK